MTVLNKYEQRISLALFNMATGSENKEVKTLETAPPALPLLSTREISEVCGMNIYKTRYYLLKLEACGRVTRLNGLKKSSVYWLPSENFHCTHVQAVRPEEL